MVLRVGQVGVGYWGPNLLRNLRNNPRCDVVAVCDLSAERRAFVERQHPGILTVDSAEQLLADPRIDAIVIATPVATHAELARAAMEAGKHVLVEKPLATSVGAVEELAAVAASRGRVLMVGHTYLFHPAVLRLREYIDSGHIGDLRYIYATRVNLGRIRSDVDALWNFGPHDVSILQWLRNGAEPSEVLRRGMGFVQTDVEDVVFLHLEYPDGVMAHVHLSWLNPRKTRTITVVGSERMIVFDDLAEYKLAVYDKGIDRVATLGTSMDYDVATPTFHHRTGEVHLPHIPNTEPLATEIDHWFDCIENGDPCRTGPDHARSVTSILERAATGRPKAER